MNLPEFAPYDLKAPPANVLSLGPPGSTAVDGIAFLGTDLYATGACPIRRCLLEMSSNFALLPPSTQTM
jgi:hypothetical protein